MKKIIAILLLLCMMLAIIGCGSKDAREESNEISEQNVVSESEISEDNSEQSEISEIEEASESEETSEPEVTENTMRYSEAAMEQINSLGKTVENEQIVLLKSGSVDDKDFVWYRVYVYEDGVNLREENYYFVIEGATEKLIATAETWDENGGFTTSDSKSLTIYEEEGWLVTTKEAPGYTWSGNSWQQDYDYLKANPDIGTIIE